MRQAFTPYRTDEIIAIARATAERFRGMTIEAVAEREGIILQFLPDATATKAGFCCVLTVSHPKPIASLACVGAALFSFDEEEETIHQAIVINPTRTAHPEEVFWHEYFHLQYSPSRLGGATFFGGYSTAGVLDKQEERRADVFSAYLLICEVEPTDTPTTIARRYNSSERLATVRLTHK
jgi:hypothetical protein